MKPSARLLIGLFAVGWLGGVIYVLSSGLSDNGGLIFLLFASLWLALAVACFRKGRGGWVLGAIIVPIVAFSIGFLLALLGRPQRTGGLEDLGYGLGAALLVVGISILSSYLVLALGAIWPRAKTPVANAKKSVHYYTRWLRSDAGGDSGDWIRGPDFYSISDARRWAQGERLQGISVVEVFTRGPRGTKVVASIEVPEQLDPEKTDATDGETATEDDVGTDN